MIKKLIEKWTCKHKWEVHGQINVHDSGKDLPHTVRQTLICKECGKIKQIEL